MAKDEVIRIRVDLATKKAWAAAAKAAKVTLSQFIINGAHSGLGVIVATKPPKQKPEKVVATKIETNGRKPFVCLLKKQ